MTILLVLLTVSLGPATALPDRYSEVMGRLDSLNNSRFARIARVGKSVRGKQLHAVMLTCPSEPESISSDKVRILLLSGQHGNEPSAVYAMLDLADEFADTRDPSQRELLERLAIIVVPVVNRDGFASLTRQNAAGADLNRNWTAPDQPETKAVCRLVEEFRPHVLIDLHEWVDRYPERTDCVEVSGFGQAAHHKLARVLSALARHRMAEAQAGQIESARPMQAVYYGQQADPGLAHRHFTNMGVCGMLVETSPEVPAEARRRACKAFVLAALSMLASQHDPLVSEQLSAIQANLGEVEPGLAALFAPRPTSSNLGQMACCFVLLAAVAYVLVQSVGTRGNALWLLSRSGRSRKGRVQVSRILITEAVRSNLPVHAKVALIQQFRTRPTDRTQRPPARTPQAHKRPPRVAIAS